MCLQIKLYILKLYFLPIDIPGLSKQNKQSSSDGHEKEPTTTAQRRIIYLQQTPDYRQNNDIGEY